MAKFFSMLNSPRFGVAIGFVCIAFGVFVIINNYTFKTNSSDWFIVAFSCVIICGACSLDTGLLRKRNAVQETNPSRANGNPSEQILDNPEFPPKKTNDDE